MSLPSRAKVLVAAAAILAAVLLVFSCGKKPQTLESTHTRMTAPGLTKVSFTGSMRPTLKGGEILSVKATPFEDVKLGDVIITWWEGRKINVIHRVIAFVYDHEGKVAGFVTKGDGNAERDVVITTRTEYVGVVELPIRK